MQQYTVSLIEDPISGDLILPFPDGLLAAVGWVEGDTVEWVDNNNGTFSLVKVPPVEPELVLVECVQQFRTRYLVEVPKGNADWALDTVTMNTAEEFSQLSLGETIVSHRVVSENEAIAIYDVDNSWARAWPREQKLAQFVTHLPVTKD